MSQPPLLALKLVTLAIFLLSVDSTPPFPPEPGAPREGACKGELDLPSLQLLAIASESHHQWGRRPYITPVLTEYVGACRKECASHFGYARRRQDGQCWCVQTPVRGHFVVGAKGTEEWDSGLTQGNVRPTPKGCCDAWRIENHILRFRFIVGMHPETESDEECTDTCVDDKADLWTRDKRTGACFCGDSGDSGFFSRALEFEEDWNCGQVVLQL